MLTYVESSLFDSPAQTLVNTVNTVGVMGKGVAKTFREIFPEMFHDYQRLCEEGRLQVGGLHLYRGAHKYVLNFPTKQHWRNPSRPEFIEAGLNTFVNSYLRWGISSISFPPLGCGNGALDYETQVRPIMERYLGKLPIPVYVHLYTTPAGRPEHEVPEETRKWLRAVPRDLSFWEVWDDIREIVGSGRQFHTAQKITPYRVEVYEPTDNLEEGGLNFRAAGKRFNVEREDLRSFWVQLRTTGFISSVELPAKLERAMSYLAPVLAELPYVAYVRMSSDFEALQRRRPAWGLRYRRPDLEVSQDNSLFDPSPIADLRAL